MKTLQEKADKANIHKRVDPYSSESRGFSEGFIAGYKKRSREIKTGRITDKELLKKFDEAVRQPNMIVGDARLCMKIAKDYAG